MGRFLGYNCSTWTMMKNTFIPSTNAYHLKLLENCRIAFHSCLYEPLIMLLMLSEDLISITSFKNFWLITWIKINAITVDPYRNLIANLMPKKVIRYPPIRGVNIPIKPGTAFTIENPLPVKSDGIESAIKAEDAGNCRYKKPVRRLASASIFQSFAMKYIK